MRSGFDTRPGLFAACSLLFFLAACGGDGGGGVSGDGDADGTSDAQDGQDGRDGATGADGEADGSTDDGSTDDGSTDDGSDGSGDGDPDEDCTTLDCDYSLTVSDTPFVAAYTNDAARAVTQLVPREGGMLRTTGADGTAYSLVIPDGVLIEPIEITMTPIATLTVDGLETERSVGVSFEPEGFEFLFPVDLEITPPEGTEWPLTEQIPVGFDGLNHHVALAPLQKSESVHFSVLHFSSYALLLAQKGMNATLEPARHRLGGREEERLSSAASELLARERQAQLLGQAEGGTEIAGLEALMDEYYEKVVKVRMAASKESCAKARLAFQTFTGFERQNQLLGRDTSKYYGQSSFADLIGDMGTTCMKEEHELCVDEHIITRILPTFLSFLRIAELVGLNPTGFTPSWLQDAEEYVRKCLQFELAMEGSVDYVQTSPPAHTMKENVASRVPVRYTASFLGGVPGGSGVIGDFEALITGELTTMTASGLSFYHSEDCTQVTNVQAKNGRFGISFMTFAGGQGSVVERAKLKELSLSVAFEPNFSSYDLRWGTRGTTGCEDYEDSSQIESFGTQAVPLISDRYITEDGGVVIKDWTVQDGSDIPATKDIAFTEVPDNGEGSVQVALGLQLFHKPVP